jgi:double-stranded uracil-DNA glycosylase
MYGGSREPVARRITGPRPACYTHGMPPRAALPDLPGLPDILVPGLALVFVGSNPSIRAGQTGHYYAHPGNRFYPLLHESGLTPRRLRPEEDGLLPHFGIGLTDLYDRPSRRADDVPDTIYRAGRERLMEKMLRYQPRWLCCNGARVYQNLTGANGPVMFGPQADGFADCRLFVVPSTSGLNSALTTVRREAFLALAAAVRDQETTSGFK